MVLQPTVNVITGTSHASEGCVYSIAGAGPAPLVLFDRAPDGTWLRICAVSKDVNIDSGTATLYGGPQTILSVAANNYIYRAADATWYGVY